MDGRVSESKESIVSTDPDTSQTGLSRRTIIGAAAWSAPVIALSVATPAVAASGSMVVFTTPGPVSTAPGALLPAIAGQVTGASGPTTVTVTLPTGWTFAAGKSGTVTTDGSGAFVIPAGTIVASTSVTPASGALIANAPSATPGSLALATVVSAVPVATSGIVWGENADNTLFVDSSQYSSNLGYAVVPTFIGAGNTFAAASIIKMAGAYRSYSSFLIRDDNTLWSHGDGNAGTASGTTGTKAGQFPLPLANGERLIDIAGFTGGGFALTNFGSVFAWGYNTGVGTLGNGTTGDTWIPVRVTFPAGVFITSISASYTGGIALDQLGQVWTWGINDGGDLGTGNTASTCSLPARVVDKAGTPISGITQVAGAFKHSLALKGDQVYSWGYGPGGMLGDGTTTTRRYADWVLSDAGTPLTGVAKIAVAYHEAYHNAVLMQNGDIYSWGFGSYFVHDPNSQSSWYFPAKSNYDLSTIGTITDVSVSYYGIHVLTQDGSVWNWGYGIYGQGGNNKFPTYITQPVQAMVDATTPVVAAGLWPSPHGGVVAHL